jgi:hypothetical protein
MAAVDAAHREDRHGRGQAHLGAIGFIDRKRATDQAAGAFERRHAMPAEQREAPARSGLARQLDHAQGHVARGAPDDVVARQGVAVAQQAALDPVHGGHELQAAGHQPVVDLGAGVFDVVARPLAGQHILLAEFTEANPVAQGNLGGVLEFHAPLQRRVHQRHAAEGPQCQAAQPLGRVAIHQGHALPGAQAFQRGHQPGQAAADDENIRLNCACHVGLLVSCAHLHQAPQWPWRQEAAPPPRHVCAFRCFSPNHTHARRPTAGCLPA